MSAVGSKKGLLYFVCVCVVMLSLLHKSTNWQLEFIPRVGVCVSPIPSLQCNANNNNKFYFSQNENSQMGFIIFIIINFNIGENSNEHGIQTMMNSNCKTSMVNVLKRNPQTSSLKQIKATLNSYVQWWTSSKTIGKHHDHKNSKWCGIHTMVKIIKSN
jgi:hypothetical protein